MEEELLKLIKLLQEDFFVDETYCINTTKEYNTKLSNLEKTVKRKLKIKKILKEC